MQEITNQVSDSLICLWSHERGEMTVKQIDAASDKPKWSLVDKAGAALDTTADGYDGADAYGIHETGGKVYWANAVFNSAYISWPTGTTDAVKALVVEQLEKAFIVIKEGA